LKKDDQNPQFVVWLEAYGKRLVEITRTCISTPSAEVSEPAQNLSQQDSPPRIVPKQE